MLKKSICAALAFVLVMGLTVSGAGAVTFSDANEIVHTEAVNRAAEKGLFVGTDGKFMPKGTVTRAQMATVVVKMMYGSDFNANPYKGLGKFPDTANFESGWAEGYICLCAQDGIVKGYGDGTFQPGNKVNAGEAVTMILNALKVDAGQGTWPETVMKKGTELGLFAELSGVTADTVLNRDQLAALVIAGVDWQQAQKESTSGSGTTGGSGSSGGSSGGSSRPSGGSSSGGSGAVIVPGGSLFPGLGGGGSSSGGGSWGGGSSSGSGSGSGSSSSGSTSGDSSTGGSSSGDIVIPPTSGSSSTGLDVGAEDPSEGSFGKLIG